MHDLDLQTLDWPIRHAACAVWGRLPPDVRRALDGTRVYSGWNLRCEGNPVLGYARQSTKAIYIRENGYAAAIMLPETIVHELAHIYLGAIGADYTDENAVKALIVQWGFAHERWLGHELIGD